MLKFQWSPLKQALLKMLNVSDVRSSGKIIKQSE